ncbi:MAG: CZB domain-containing protein [Alphaproteobacteria bacterium]
MGRAFPGRDHCQASPFPNFFLLKRSHQTFGAGMSTNSDLVQQINAAIGAHGVWKLKLKTAIDLGRAEVTPDELRCDSHCAFGEWLHSDVLSESIKAGKPYQVIRRIHAEFHECAADILSHAISGRKDDAKAMFDKDYAERSGKLTQALYKWKREVAA